MARHRIFKYPLEVVHRQVVHMHETAVPLWVTEQNEQLVLYARVQDPDPGVPQRRMLQVVTTGDVFEGDGKRFIGACTLGTWFQAFVFELVPEEHVDGDSRPSDTIDHRHDDDYRQIRQEQHADQHAEDVRR